MNQNKQKILQDLRVLSETKMRKNLDDIKLKVANKFYDQSRIRNIVAERILKDLRS